MCCRTCFTELIKCFLTQQLTKLSNFQRESGDFLHKRQRSSVVTVLTCLLSIFFISYYVATCETEADRRCNNHLMFLFNAKFTTRHEWFGICCGYFAKLVKFLLTLTMFKITQIQSESSGYSEVSWDSVVTPHGNPTACRLICYSGCCSFLFVWWRTSVV